MLQRALYLSTHALLLLLCSGCGADADPKNGTPGGRQDAEKNSDVTSQELEPQEEWRSKTLAYVAAVNAYDNERALGTKGSEPPKEPGREHLAVAALAALRQANASEEWTTLREKWPPAHRPFAAMLDEKAQHIPVVCLLPDGSVLARVGAHEEEGRTVRLVGSEVRDEPSVDIFGRGPKRRLFAVARAASVEVIDGWGGEQVASCAWPSGLEGLPEEAQGIAGARLKQPPTPTQLIPFPDGRRVLLVSRKGIFVLTDTEATRLLPTPKELQAKFEAWRVEPDEEFSISLATEHGAISNDGRLIAVGAQGTTHLLFDHELQPVANIAKSRAYAHCAVFSAEATQLALNSAYLYEGTTLGVRCDSLPALDTTPSPLGAQVRILDNHARVYAGVARDDEYIFGDAHGYVRAVSLEGEHRWQHFVGSTIDSLDVSTDGKTLVVATSAGFVSIITLDAGATLPYQIGNGGHVEIRRWIFWKSELRPLLW